MISSKEGKLGSEDMRISNAWNSLNWKLFQHQFVDSSFPKEWNDDNTIIIGESIVTSIWSSMGAL
jgi:hypothetical protein